MSSLLSFEESSFYRFHSFCVPAKKISTFSKICGHGLRSQTYMMKTTRAVALTRSQPAPTTRIPLILHDWHAKWLLPRVLTLAKCLQMLMRAWHLQPPGSLFSSYFSIIPCRRFLHSALNLQTHEAGNQFRQRDRDFRFCRVRKRIRPAHLFQDPLYVLFIF